MKIPFNKIYSSGREPEYIDDCIQRGSLAGNGYYTQKVQEYLQQQFNCPKVLLTTSCTSALEMAGLLIDLKPGDEVILPSFTFVSTANAVLLRGAKPVFAEVEPDTLNIDPADVQRKITELTRAIIPVHYAGIACSMDEIMAIACRYKLIVIEDAAQGVNAGFKGKYLGTIGHIGCYSFHATKNYVCGEGGAILINTGDNDFMERAEWIWEKGTNRSQFLRGQVDKYSWVCPGSSYLPSDILAAYLLAQLEDMKYIQEARKKVYSKYSINLREFEYKGILRLPAIPSGTKPNYHIFYLIFNTGEERDYVQKELKKAGIEAPFHYVPLHTSPMGMKLGYKTGDFPVTEDASRKMLRLPLYPDIKEDEQDYVLDKLGRLLAGL